MRFTHLLYLALALVVSAGEPLHADEPAAAPIPPGEAAAKMTLPEGFKATLFAGEPDVVQPIAFCFDDRGRLWVVESMAYPEWQPIEQPGEDRIVIFEDADGDGKFDSRKVFLSNGTNFAGIEYGFGGVWVCATPHLLFIPDRNADDKADEKWEVVLDGWDIKAKHNVCNGLTWGPDGWLWGLNGILSNSKIGKPGTPDAERVAMNCGVWRIHPVTKKFEVVASGTTNPWGLDFDDYGHAFITNCVIHHLWHVIPGAHFQRMFGQDLTPNTYELLPSCADYLHWAGGAWQASRTGEEHRRAGGGHAHAGAMIYLGDNWPAQHRNSLFTCNIHGNRVNEDRLKQVGSAYDAERADDFLFANDPWHRGLELGYGPDGGVYLTDWCDTDECHDYVDIHRENGRIYKITYGETKPWFGDLQKLPSLELVKLQKHPNEFFVRHARRILQERVTPGLASPEMSVAGVRQALVTMLETETESTRKLRALWTLWAIGAADSHFLLEQLASPDAHVREWAVRLLSDGPPERTALEKFVALAKTDPAPAVRLALASALQKIPLNQRAPLALALVAHAEDATDRTLPLMLWYGIEPLIASKNIDAAALLKETAIPKVLQLVARRIASEHEGAADQAILNKTRTALYEWIDKPQSVAATRAALTGVREAQEGTINSKATTNPAYRYLSPDTTARLIESDDAEIRNTALILSLWSGDEKARDVLKKIVMDKKKPTVDREGALSALVTAFGPELKRLWVVVDGRVQDRSVDGESVDLSPMLHGLLDEPEMRVAALRRLPIFDNPATSAEILKRYDAMSLSEKQEALTALASRPKMALPLLAAIEAKTVPQSDVSAYTVRQLQALKSDEINAKLTALWGTLRAPAEGKAELMKEYKSWLTAPAIMKADAKKGRAVFTRTCAGCHTLFDAGGNVGPNLTGSQRANVDYLLENLLDPSAVVANSYQTNVVETSDGRTIVGVVEQENDQSLALKTPGGLVVVAKSDVADRQKSPLSLMPENMLQLMPREDLLDLAAYLASDEQVTALEARPGEANNAPKK